jgi:hypothetical protein
MPTGIFFLVGCLVDILLGPLTHVLINYADTFNANFTHLFSISLLPIVISQFFFFALSS